MSDTIRVLFFRDGEGWAAQCLEYDIGAQALDLKTLRMRMDVVLSAELSESVERNGEPFKGIAPAPARFEDMWADRASAFSGDGVESVFEASGRSLHVDRAIAA